MSNNPSKIKSNSIELLHYLQLCIAVAFSLLLFYVGIDNLQSKPMKGIGHIINAGFLLSFGLLHLYTVRYKGIFVHKAVSFLPVYILFGYLFEYAWLGYSKSWAPSTNEEVTLETIKWVLIIIGLIGVGLYSVFYKSKHIHD